MCVLLDWKMKIISLFSLFLLLFMNFILFFDIIYELTNFYVTNFNKISGI